MNRTPSFYHSNTGGFTEEITLWEKIIQWGKDCVGAVLLSVPILVGTALDTLWKPPSKPAVSQTLIWETGLSSEEDGKDTVLFQK